MSLLEILVALVILSVGMMGIALMLVHNLSNNRSALLRTQAVNLVSDMSDRIRANAGGGDAYDFEAHAGEPSTHDCAPGAAAGSGGNCSPVELAEDDLARWQSDARLLLPPSATGTPTADVQYFAGDPRRYRVIVAWHEPGEALPFSYESEILVQGTP